MMDRREFLWRGGAAAAGLVFTGERLLARDDAAWRTFQLTTQVEVLEPAGMTRLWMPIPMARELPFQRVVAPPSIRASGGTARILRDARTNVSMIFVEWPAGKQPVLSTVSRVATRDIRIDTSVQAQRRTPAPSNLRRYLEPTSLVPTDGIVRQQALEITKGAAADIDKARAIYDWVVDSTAREPTVRGCGVGDIRFMLETRDLRGKCADINALFVGLARAAGLPARDLYGVRVAPSGLGYRSLGLSSNDATRAQHCRAEVFLNGCGWTPVDPADVRKVMLEEPPGNLTTSDDTVIGARRRLFGGWEMNWIAYNDAQDVHLPHSTRRPVPFLMYPQAETGGRAIDSLDPDRFRYRITVHEAS
jgi:transglutaminase-like putative cysteine protease